MRQIKFRAWNKNWKEMEHDIDDITPSDDYILMQYTGLKDKNGKEIYEGDIVRFHYFYGSIGSNMGFVEAEHELVGVVGWAVYGWGLNAIRGEHWRGYTGYGDGEGESSLLDLCSMSDGSIHEDSFEVIGNIHENPDLL
jgi:uncharacterized phage protein (TIGR01671 family)